MNGKAVPTTSRTSALVQLTSSFDAAENVFSEKLQTKVLDWKPEDTVNPWKQHLYENSLEFQQSLRNRSGVRLRIISFHSAATCLPLKVPVTDFKALVDEYNVDPEFADTVLAFGRFPDPANGHTTTPMISRHAGSESFEAWYRLQYPEGNNRSSKHPWSIRHTGVYHQYNADKDLTVILLLHPCRDTILERTLFDETSQLGHQVREQLVGGPMSIHQILCDTYLPNWLPCIQRQSSIQEKINDDVQTSDLKAGNLENDFKLTQRLRFLKSETATQYILCQDTIAVLDELKRLFPNSSPWQFWIKVNRSKATARHASLHLIQERIQNDIDLLQHAATQRDSRINQRNQTIAARLNETLLNLTYNTVDDSATIKVITLLSLIFLPGSFIGTIFGMNFFGFHDDNDDNDSDHPGSWTGLTIGQNFWIFVAVWLPVTAIVLAIYFGVTWKRQKSVLKKRKSAKQIEGEAMV